MPIYALMDCNNFYASCERAFNPKLEGKPIVVLSNNDGCIIARSNEAKTMGIPMGAPYYEWRRLCEKNNVHVFSSNYELYGDMSQRVMTTLGMLCPDIEIYSIDEAFLLLDGFQYDDLLAYVTHVRQTVKQWTGISVSIGIGPTKTLAKAANRFAKKLAVGVFDIGSRDTQDRTLELLPAEDIWGIGKNSAAKLKTLHIHTAKELRDADLKHLRQQFSVVMERIIQELRGVSCLPIESVQPHKQIMSSRSFGTPVTQLSDLEEALSHYAATACLKLRQQKNLANGVYIFLHTSFFNDHEPRYANGASAYFAVPTNDTSHIIHLAKSCLHQLYQPGFRYRKAGIMLLDLVPQSIQQLDLFTETSPHKSDLVISTMDAINQSLGKNTLFFCAEGTQRAWQIKCDKRTPRYTTQWHELVKVQL